VVGGESWSLVWEWGSLTSVISGAPSTSLAKSGTSAFPGLGALLGTLPVVGLGNAAVLVVGMASSVFSPVASPECAGVVVVLTGGWNVSVAEANGWWGTGLSGGDQSGECEVFHYFLG
jgi:hypothetical protein